MSISSTGGSLKVLNRSTRDLYRDCLRLVKHIAGNSNKATQIKIILKKEFMKNSHIKDEDTIATLKGIFLCLVFNRAKNFRYIINT